MVNKIASRCSDGQLTENFTQHTDVNANADVWFSVYASSTSSIWALKERSMHRNARKFVHNYHCLDLMYWMYKKRLLVRIANLVLSYRPATRIF